uniref:Uncharacterized protein n=1 Tax=viral metagenome TaxID=1070528 RepID=A0A6M3L4P4_9ZZZZ
MTAIERIAKVTAWDDEEYVYEIHEITFADVRLAADCIAAVRALANQQDWQGDSGQVLTTMTIDGAKLSALAARIKEASL